VTFCKERPTVELDWRKLSLGQSAFSI